MRVFLFSVFYLALVSCETNDLFEKRNAIPHNKWKSTLPVEGKIEVSDTTAMYNLYVCIRHTDAYLYNNIWLDMQVLSDKDTLFHSKREVILGTDAEGWEGEGMDDIWDLKKRINPTPFKFKKPGDVLFRIKHCMRADPLEDIMSVGLRLEKIK